MKDINFKELILILQSRGYTQYVIAEKIGCSQSYISDIVRGRNKGMGFKRGLKLIAFEKNTRNLEKYQDLPSDIFQD